MPMVALLIAATAAPLLLLLFCLRRNGRERLPALMPWAALPALALALFAHPGLTLELPWLLLGSRIGVDATGRTFLLFTALLWSIAGAYARAYFAADARAPRFAGFFMATLTGNIGFILAQDIATFYFFYALTTFAAFGLIAHAGDDAARRAGRVYLVMAIGGEAMLFLAFMLMAGAAGTMELTAAASAIATAPARDAILALLLAGFGIKVGVVPLHLWLPLAHPVAPTPASAVLSGAIIKAGLLGWLRCLPAGEIAMPHWGMLLIAAGIATVFYGVAVGLAQRDAKVVLAYSSISQMGFMTVGAGAGLFAPQAWPALWSALALYALHHGFAKGALFLGVGVMRAARKWRGAVLCGLLLPALALAGAPFTSGALAKFALKDALAALPGAWPGTLAYALAAAAVGTTLLMMRFLWCVWRAPLEAHHDARPLAWPWLASLGAVLALTWLTHPQPLPLSASALFTGAWPVLLGVPLALAAMWVTRHGPAPTLPAGDVLVPIERALRHLAGLSYPRPQWRTPPSPPSIVAIGRTERALHSWRAVGMALLLLFGLFALVLAVG
jgi:formate hydrogenlyase subunit 3/multisubunit Na+/H+ antiporter MnhD subunit